MKTHSHTLNHKLAIDLPETMRKLTHHSRASDGESGT